jgi:predicted MPP superfamily phosphohydrolase
MNAEHLSQFAFALLLVGALVGHVSLSVRSHNYFYGCPLSRRVGDVVQLAHGLVAVAAPLVFWWTGGPELVRTFSPDTFSMGPALLAAYFSLCVGVGFIALPLVTVARLVRRPPAALVETRTRTLDVSAELGYRPVGDGTFALLSRLPANEVFRVEFAERDLRLLRLPAAWDGLKILHLSDFHFCGTPARPFFELVIREAARWEPDLVALTGDFVDSAVHRRWMLPVLSQLRWRVAAFAILGNHDYYYEPPRLRRRLRRAGFQVLANEWKRIDVRGQPLDVVGHEGPWFLPLPADAPVPSDVFRLCLSHTPDNLSWARRQGIDLMLSGHVHGGQVRLPLLGSVLVPSRFGRRYDCGTFASGPTVLQVSRGLSGEHPLRYHCQPEVTLLTLKAGEG